ncbi:MAG: hypothetical protein IMF01_09440 [Proteobacteria bacterium]|nr:hypothetical protein [Pseudomonadota bacterium]
MSNRKYKVDESVLTSVRSWTVGRSKNKNTPYVKVTFDNYIDWTGWLTDKTMERTMQTLAMMGFKGSNLGMLKDDNALNKELELAAVIEEAREYKGKWYHSAKWINKVGGFAGDMDDDLANMDTRAYINNPIDVNSEPSNDYSDIHTDASFTADDIPF